MPGHVHSHARAFCHEAVDEWLWRSTRTSGKGRRISAAPSLFSQEARIPDGTGPFAFSTLLVGHAAIVPRRCASAATFINKMPRGSTGTGRSEPRKQSGCSSVGRARPRHGRGNGFETRHPLHFGCALAPPPGAQPRERLGRDVHGVATPCAARAPGRLAGHSRLDTAEMETPARVAQLEAAPAL